MTTVRSSKALSPDDRRIAWPVLCSVDWMNPRWRPEITAFRVEHCWNHGFYEVQLRDDETTKTTTTGEG